mmetsp:Transcript_11205/g.35575  ORF Transcript_11205/g.35575 Transcript_11205/m.35575 type:complete len:80 (+) Transcript_11205:2151-2390(+)
MPSTEPAPRKSTSCFFTILFSLLLVTIDVRELKPSFQAQREKKDRNFDAQFQRAETSRNRRAVYVDEIQERMPPSHDAK